MADEALPRRRYRSGKGWTPFCLPQRTGLSGNNFQLPPHSFEAAFEAGTAAIMPYYGIATGLEYEGRVFTIKPSSQACCVKNTSTMESFVQTGARHRFADGSDVIWNAGHGVWKN